MAPASLLVSAVLLGILAVPAWCGGISVTEEAWFEVKVSEKNETMWQGRFTVALFGDVAPMTVMNFVALTRGYKKGKVSNYRIYLKSNCECAKGKVSNYRIYLKSNCECSKGKVSKYRMYFKSNCECSKGKVSKHRIYLKSNCECTKGKVS